MSSYMVSNETINRIISMVQERQANEHAYGTDRTIREKYFKNCTVGELRTYDNTQQLINFGNELLKLNAVAVYDRYQDMPFLEKITTFKKTWRSDRSPVQDFKTLHCFLYQCSEGDYENRELFKIMQDLVNQLANEIVTSSEAYELAKWM